MTIDLPSKSYSFPQHITPTDMRPDIVWWSDEKKELQMFKLTINYETLPADARQCKRAKYEGLVEAGCEVGYSTELITLEVGSRGMVSDDDFATLHLIFGTSRKDMDYLALAVIRSTLLESFKIWCSRNTVHSNL